MASLAEVYKRFVADISGKSASAVDTYQITMTDFIDYLNAETAETDEIEVGEIEKDVITDFVEHLLIEEGYADSTVTTRYKFLQGFFSYCFDEKYIDINPTDRIDLYDDIDPLERGRTEKAAITKAKENVVYVEASEVEQLAENVQPPRTRNELIIRLMWQTGLRAEELVNIRVNKHDFRQEERKITVETAKREKTVFRSVWYQPSLDILMRRWLTDRESMLLSNCPYMFITNRNSTVQGTTNITSSRVNKIVKDAAENAGIQEVLYTDADGNKRCRITSHALRHGYGVYAVQDHGDGGMDIRTLQLLMGHADIETTSKYLQFADDTLQKKAKRHGPG